MGVWSYDSPATIHILIHYIRYIKPTARMVLF